MKRFRLFVNICLIAILSSSFGVEFVAIQDTADALSTSVVEVEASVASKATNADAHHNDSDCSDPCHVGQCHFGHCSFAFAQSGLNYSILANSSLSVFSVDTLTDGPVLEGPRRPPKNS